MKTTKRNQKFTDATPQQKRMMIARDVLAQLDARKFMAKSGAFIRLNFRKPELVPNGKQICKLRTSARNCQCCAYGAMMLSEIGFNDNAVIGGDTIRDSFNESVHHIFNEERADRLHKFFPKGQLRLIEIAFESGLGWYAVDSENGEEMRAKNLFRRGTSPRRRMRAIMENIIRNNGTFIVP